MEIWVGLFRGEMKEFMRSLYCTREELFSGLRLPLETLPRSETYQIVNMTLIVIY
jgi:hypothetical protein